MGSNLDGTGENADGRERGESRECVCSYLFDGLSFEIQFQVRDVVEGIVTNSLQVANRAESHQGGLFERVFSDGHQVPDVPEGNR